MCRPTRPLVPGEEFQIWPARIQPLNLAVLFIRLAGVLTLHGSNDIDLTSSRRKSTDILSPHTEQNYLGGVAEIKAYPSPVRATILAHLVPD